MLEYGLQFLRRVCRCESSRSAIARGAEGEDAASGEPGRLLSFRLCVAVMSRAPPSCGSALARPASCCASRKSRSHPVSLDLDAAAIRVAKATRYAAGTKDGTAVPESCIKFKVKFVPHNH